jgi:YegS/Rv2252/BmrU family lipid kinase
MTTAILYNPAAGRGRARSAIARIATEVRRDFRDVEMFATEGPGDGKRLGRLIGEQGFERLIVVGGDGSVHDAANGVLSLPETQRPLVTVIPVGTGNDFAKLVGTHGLSPRNAVRQLVHGTPARFDVGEAWGEYFVNSLGLGLDYHVPYHLQSVKRLRGTPAYGLALLRALRHYRDVGLTVTVGDATYHGRWLTVAIGIGPIEGGGFHLMPGARPDDGLFDVCTVRPASLLRIITLIPLVMMAKHVGMKEVSLTRTTTVHFKGDHPLQLHADGELRAPGQTELTVTLKAGVLPVLRVAGR